MESESGTPASLSDGPTSGQTVYHDGRRLTSVQEGLAHILVPPDLPTVTDPKAPKDGSVPVQQVFYNPIQQFNRDLSVLAIRAFGEDSIARRTIQHQKSVEQKSKRKAKLETSVESVTAADASNEQPAKRMKTGVGGDTKDGQAHQKPTNGNGIANENEVDPEDILDEEMFAIEQSMTQKQSATEAQSNVREQETEANPPQRSPRHLTVKILDALSATGLRALRYARELPFSTRVTANDLSPKATNEIARNVEHNRLAEKITVATGNAVAHMYQYVAQEGLSALGQRYDVIDLDPYGTAAPFLDAAVQALADGGLLCVTFTDSGVFASTGYLEKTFALYGGLPIKGLHSHEGGLRLVLHAIASSAARYGISIEPLLSLSIDYYIRVFVRVKRSPAEVKFLAGKTMLVYACDAGCGSWKTQFLARNSTQQSKRGTVINKHQFAQGPSADQHCEHCEFRTHLCGPMWGGPLHNPAFIEKILSYLPELDTKTYGTIERIEGMLTTAYEEISPETKNNRIDNTAPEQDETAKALMSSSDPASVEHHPFYFLPSVLAKVVHCQAPPEAAIKGALRHAGYRATRSHAKRGAVRTNAPWSVIWEIMREWIRQKAPIKDGSVRPGTAGWNILRLGERAEGDTGVGANGSAEPDAPPKPGDKADPEKQPLKVVFDERLGQDRDDKKLMRFQTNPRPNWGPMTRAK